MLTEDELGSMQKSILAKIAAIVDDTTLILNVGTEHGVIEGMVFSVVAEQQERLRVCENADEFADQIFKGTGKELLKTRGRPIKMTLEIPGEIPVSRQH